MHKALCFDDVLLVPGYFTGNSRKEIKLNTEVAGVKLALPIISANMPSVTTPQLAVELAKVGGLGILDRMGTIQNQVDSIIEFNKLSNMDFDFPNGKAIIGGSVGIGNSIVEDSRALISTGAGIICIDVAHAAQSRLNIAYLKFRDKFPDFPLIVGNYATPDFINFHAEMAQDKNLSIKVGVGGGSHCTTRIQTGCGVPTLESGLMMRKEPRIKNFILDGGIKSSGDIVKSLAAGASAVMIGSLFAGTKEAGGSVIVNGGKKYKVYRGNASAGTKLAVQNSSEFVEGEESLVPYKGSIAPILSQLDQGIRSGFSYVGALNLKEFHKKADFIEISSAGYHESKPHGAI